MIHCPQFTRPTHIKSLRGDNHLRPLLGGLAKKSIKNLGLPRQDKPYLPGATRAGKHSVAIHCHVCTALPSQLAQPLARNTFIYHRVIATSGHVKIVLGHQQETLGRHIGLFLRAPLDIACNLVQRINMHAFTREHPGCRVRYTLVNQDTRTHRPGGNDSPVAGNAIVFWSKAGFPQELAIGAQAINVAIIRTDIQFVLVKSRSQTNGAFGEICPPNPSGLRIKTVDLVIG